MNQNTIVDARWNYSGNTKVGQIATFSTLPSDKVFESQKYGKVQGTCSGCCEHCGHSINGKRPPCYVFKSHRYPSVVDSQARNTLSVRNDTEKAFRQLSDSLSRKRKPVNACRYNQSGEIENKEMLLAMANVAREHENTPFFVYTKKYDIVVSELLNGNIPENMTVLISVWHEQGIEAFKKVKHLKNVKAFVYMDKNSDKVNGYGIEEYSKLGIEVTTVCKAYGLDKKMNHNITCDKCQKCYNRLNSCKVVGCYDH